MLKRLLLLCLISLHADPLIVCLAGGSGSGKTTVAQRIADRFGNNVLIISQDAYYKDLSHLPLHEREATNFDHPNSLDFELLISHVNELKASRPIECPIYDFTLHTRLPQTSYLEAKEVIIVEGILLMAIPEVRELFDVKLYIDTDDDIRLLRRLNRDISERGRTLESVQKQYLTTVRPMYLQFVEPSKRHADLIIPWGRHNDTAVDFIVSNLKAHIN